MNEGGLVAGRVRMHERLAALFAVGLAGLSLAAWASGRPGWVSLPPSHAAMVPASAAMVILLAVAAATSRRAVAVVAAAVAFGAAGSALILHGWDWRFPLDHLVSVGRLATGRGEWGAKHAAASTLWTVMLLTAGLLADRSGVRRPLLRVAGRLAGTAGGLLAASVVLSEVAGVAGFSLSSEPTPARGVSTATAVALAVLASAVQAGTMSASRRELIYGAGYFPRAARTVVVGAVVIPVTGFAVVDALGVRLALQPADQTALLMAVTVVAAAATTLVLLDRLRQAADRAEEESRRLAAVVATSQDAIYTYGLDGLITSWNEGAERLYGYPAALVLGRSVSMLAPPEPVEEMHEVLERIVRGEEVASFDTMRVHRDGTLIDVSLCASPILGPEGRIVGASMIARDIAAQKEAEDRFSGLVEFAPDATVIVGTDGRIVVVNRQAEWLFGYPREQLVGQPVEQLLPEAFRTLHAEQRATYTARPVARPMAESRDLTGLRADGSEFPAEISLSPLITRGGTLVSAAVRDVTEHRRIQAALSHQALHDALTGLPNRVLLADRLEVALGQAGRSRSGVAVLFIDLDSFKLVNDSRGHHIGDQILVAVTERLGRVTRPADTVARFGGDEFVVICQDGGFVQWKANAVAERIAEVLQEPFAITDGTVYLSASIGIAIAEPGMAATADTLLRDADTAMYHAKGQGPARIEFFDERMRMRAAGRIETRSALHHAIDYEELRVFYQPIVDLRSLEVAGVEALVRWQHPDHGLLGPDAFIPLAEDAGLIVPIGAWVLDQAAKQWSHWRHDWPSGAPLAVSVNLSARQLQQSDLVESVLNTLHHAGMDPTALCLELTENTLVEDTENQTSALHALRRAGISLAIDDFGTGYSMLGYLKRFPINRVKIDCQFVAGLERDAYDDAIVASIIDLAHALGDLVVAEGVETREQLAHLLALGCDFAQGYYFSPAKAANALDELLRPGSHPGTAPTARP